MGYAFETNNYIYGRALNPYNKNYITGGSTGVFFLIKINFFFRAKEPWYHLDAVFLGWDPILEEA